MISTGSINIHYQVIATLNLVSFLSFSQPYQAVHPVIILHGNGTSSTAEEEEGGIMPLASKCGSRLNGRIHLPCRVLPQAGTIPLTFNLALQGDTRVSKVAIELWESVVPSSQGQDQETTTTKQTDSRLVSRQNCPVLDWPVSTHEPVAISRRLIFKVPTLPLEFWTSLSDYPLMIDDSRCRLAKGVCHTSGSFPHLGFKLCHTLRAIVYFGELESSRDLADQDTAEYDIEVQVTGQHQTPAEEEHGNHLPSYSRSFCSALVEGARMQEIDRQSLEALQEVMPQWALPPEYEERSSNEGMHRYLDHPSMRPSFETSFSRPSTDTFLSDLALYSERYS